MYPPSRGLLGGGLLRRVLRAVLVGRLGLCAVLPGALYLVLLGRVLVLLQLLAELLL